ncbi:alpha/beta hydrolase [Sphingomonas sp. MMS12-HWE2-04]|uniref:alpha/beta hydrolase n=1 Tax=Sphingomonas sp. MMS12-HWE2-04 TaxID=3234199 RepID=UPI00384AA100
MRGLVLALALLLGGCGTLLSIPGDRCTGIPAQPDTLPGATSFTYRTASGRDLRIHVFQPAGPRAARPAILFFFGGGWRVGRITAFRPQAEAFAARGYVTLLADYRVTCRDGTSPLAATNDAAAAYAWLRDHAAALGINSRRIALSGGSAGGHLALVTAMKAPAAERPAALILFNPAVDLVTPARWYQKPFARGISPSLLPLAALPPTMIFHGEDDATVPIASVRTFCARATAAGRSCTVIGYRGKGHGFYHDYSLDPQIGTTPYADTLARSERFADPLLNPALPR